MILDLSMPDKIFFHSMTFLQVSSVKLFFFFALKKLLNRTHSNLKEKMLETRRLTMTENSTQFQLKISIMIQQNKITDAFIQRKRFALGTKKRQLPYMCIYPCKHSYGLTYKNTIYKITAKSVNSIFSLFMHYSIFKASQKCSVLYTNA